VFAPVIADASSVPAPLTFPLIVWLKFASTSVPAVIVRFPFHVNAAVLFSVTVGVPLVLFTTRF
jgi:hypothetical protein